MRCLRGVLAGVGIIPCVMLANHSDKVVSPAARGTGRLRAMSKKRTDVIVVDKKRRLEEGPALSESESSGLEATSARRVERGERGCCGEVGDDGGDSAKAFARAAERLDEAVGVMSRLARVVECAS